MRSGSPQARLRKIAVIVNRHAGKGKAIEALQHARRVLWGWPMEFISPDSSEELRNVCAGLSQDKYEAAVVIGGDGTINHAIRGLARTGVPLLPFPGGTANDLAAECGVKADWEQVQRLIDNNLHEAVDLIEANKVPYATVAGIGVGAALTAELNEKRRSSQFFRIGLDRLRSEIYTLLSAKTVILRNDYVHRLHVRSNVFDEKLQAAAVFICNQDRLGGNMKVARSSENHDQIFSVLIIPAAPKHQLLMSLAKLKMGRISEGDFILFSTGQVTIRELDHRPIEVFGDGETLVRESAIDFKILPQGIRVYKERRKTSREVKGANE